MVKVAPDKRALPYATPFELDGNPIIKLCARQDFPPLYAINGVVFLTREDLLKDQILVGKRPAVIETSDIEAVDIDTDIDLKFANHLARDI